MKFAFVSRLARACSMLLPILLLSACASQAWIDGRELIAAGRQEEGLAKLEQAMRESPDRREYRAFYLRQRELATAQAVAEGDMARVAGQFANAEEFYRKALGLDPGSPRAKSGLADVATARRHAETLRAAEEALRTGNLAGAEARGQAVLAENPVSSAARALMRRIEEKRPSGDPVAAGVDSPFSRPITLEFRDAPLRGVFETMSRVAGINFVFDRDVRQDLRVSIFVRNTSIDEVMRLILATNQLERKLLNANSVLIYPNTPAKAREHQELAVRTFYLANADTKQALGMIRAMTKTRDIYVDEKLNAIIVRDSPEAIRLIDKLIASIDLPEPEVMLEIEVMEISSSRIQEIGIRWPNQLQYGDLGTTAATTAINSTGGTSITTTSSTTTPPARVNINPRSALQNLSYSVLNPLAVANLRADVGASNLLANPRIRVRNREKAKIHIGDKLPVFTTTSTANVGVSSSVSYLDVGLKLDIEPNVYLDNEVAIKVGLEVSSVTREVAGPAGSIAYQIGTRLTNTVLRLKDGETQILAGLINDEDRSSGSRVPGLGDIPILGRLFGSQQDTRNKTEIVLLITPRVLRNVAPPAVLSAALPAGTEAQVGAQPLRLLHSAPGSLGIVPSPGGAPAAVADPRAAGAAFAAALAERAAATATALSLTMSAAGDAVSGREIAVNLTLSEPAPAPGLLIDLSYPPTMLQAVPPAPGAVPGRLQLTISQGATSTEARFRVAGAAGASGAVVVGSARQIDGTAINVVVPPPLILNVRP